MENYDESDAVQIWAVLEIREHVDSRRVFWNKSFLTFKQAHFLESITSQIFELSSWSFFSKYATFHVYFENAMKIWEIVFDL